MRRRLRTDSPDTHDWASIVAYAVVPYDFEQQVEDFQNYQTRQRLETKFDEADHRLLAASPKIDAARPSDSPLPTVDATLWTQLEKIYTDIRRDTQQFCAAPHLDPAELAERLGMAASSEKRIGDLFKRGGGQEKSIVAYQNACELYRKALAVHPVNHWVITQYLSMLAVLNSMKAADPADISSFTSWWKTSRQIAQWELRGTSGDTRAWALGTLAELELLGAVYDGTNFDRTAVKNQINQICRDLWEEVGKDSFPVASTRRQFLRYRDIWTSSLWNDLAQSGIDALPQGESWSGRAYVRHA
jgi:hypothetical protein